jgi:XTP/dITP diphosphohydrolase
MPDLLIATNNQGKLREMKAIIGSLPVTLLTLSDAGIKAEIDETGKTFEENAVLKATGYARLAGLPTIADDSGLVIDSLGGRPGVRSARYAGENATDADRVVKILHELKNERSRDARFVSVTALADATGEIVASVEGTCEGSIIGEPRGTAGFGYDPIFLPDGYDETFAELDPQTKNRISHRANSLMKIIPFLQGFFRIPT